MQTKKPSSFSQLMFCALAAASLAWGIYVAHRPLLETTEYLHGDFGDGRLVILFLEHSFQFVFGADFISNFWQAPWNFYPYPLTIAMSEPMAGNLFFYAPFRLVGMTMESAAKYWVLTTSVANFVSGLILFRMMGAAGLAAVIGAYLVNFSMIRINHLNHLHLFPLFPALLAIAAGIMAFRIKSKLRLISALISGLCVGWQFWCSLHIGWFLIFGLFLYSVAFSFSNRRLIAPLIRTNQHLIAMFGIGFLAVFLPLYLKMMEFRLTAEGTRTYADVLQFMLRRNSFLLPAEGSLFYANQFKTIFPKLQFGGEQCAFAGFVALLTAICSYPTFHWKLKKKPMPVGFSQFMLLTSILFWAVGLVATKDLFGYDGWKFFYNYFPGASGIRAIGRISIILNFMMAVMLVYWLSMAARSRWQPLAWVVSALVLMENFAPALARFEVSEHRARLAKVYRSIEDNCPKSTAVYFSVLAPVDVNARTDVMWYGLESHKKVINGYSGYNPPGFVLNQTSTKTQIRSWLESQSLNLADDNICIFDHP
jgi:hypothetical protein